MIIAHAILRLRRFGQRNFTHLDNHGGHVIDLGMAVGEVANGMIELMHDLRGDILSVEADNVNRTLDAEGGVVRSPGLNDAIRQ
jgi:hypothetical protein